MSQSTLYSSGFELAPFVTSSGLLLRSWKVISSPRGDIKPNIGVRLSWKEYEESHTGLTIIAFEAAFQDHLQPDLISSSALRDKNCPHFDFLCAEGSPLFFVNKTAFSLFYENHEKLDQLKSKIERCNLLIVTGRALGGSVASLFTLSLLNSFGSEEKHPLCITFGSPLIGDKNLQQAISRSSTWNSRFLHVVSHKDPLPRLFITNHSSPPTALSPQTSAYMPFGKFLFCSDVNSACFENPDFILELLVAMGSIRDHNQGSQNANYGNIVENLYRKAICKDFTAWAQDITHFTSQHASISLQLRALGFTPHMQQQQRQNIDINSLVTKVKELEFNSQKRTTFGSSERLNKMKIDMAHFECYKKDSKNRNIGYYDSYKKMDLGIDRAIVDNKKSLTKYWEEIVNEAEIEPQIKVMASRTRWLLAGTTYRRMVEPLVIAEYYKQGCKDYVKKGRSKHFIQLEEWLEEWLNKWIKAITDLNSKSKNNVDSALTIDKSFWAHIEEALRSSKDMDVNEELLKEVATAATSDLNSKSKNVESILTRDSCFWAHVEEAHLSLEELKIDAEKEEARKKLVEFEEYVYELLKIYAVSPEIFLEESSYMLWWNEYKAIEGTSYESSLASFMSNARNFEQYAIGAFHFC